MDSTMFQLRSFVHQRLFSAAEEIFEEVQKTITFALFEAEVSRSKEEVDGLLDLLQNKSAAEPSLTISTVENGDPHNDPLLQEILGPSTQEESDLSLSDELPGPSQTSAELKNKNWNHCLIQTDFRMSEIKEEQEEVGDDTQTKPSDFILTTAAEPSMTSSTAEVGDEHDAPLLQENAGSSAPEESNLSQTQEQDQTEAQQLYEMQPLSSDFSDAESVNNDYDEDLLNSEGTQTKTMKRTGKKLQRQSGSKNEKDQAALSNDKTSAKAEKGRSFCHVCGKGFQYVGALIKHVKTHEKTTDCKLCGKKYQSAKQLSIHMKSHHNTTCFCGKTFSSIRCLRLHEKIHTGIKDFKCEECGKAFYQKAHLIIHTRTHSQEKPYHCDICGKAFTQNYSLKDHKRRHSSEKPYRCDLCGKLFITYGSLRGHIRFHSAETHHPCDICGKSFGRNRQMSKHRNMRTGERPHGCPICGMRYRFLSGLTTHMKIHGNASE